MERGGGGTDGGSFRLGHLPSNNPSPLLFRPCPPPLTAIDKFLLSRQSHFSASPSSLSSCFNINIGYGCGGISSSSFSWPKMPETVTSFGGGSLNWIHEENNNNNNNNSIVGLKNETAERILYKNNNHLIINKGAGIKRAKGFGSSSTPLIKGQWTDEEDRKLIRLVKQYGVRKWAQIADKMMIGRAGKQCRERWHNHLRPDIKKDVWSEEEERLLVEAHEKVGNKWAEIAKKIPGRTENSIKNHWNATKRRQNSRRNKIKKQQQQQQQQQQDDRQIGAGLKTKGKTTTTKTTQSTILQDYIRSKTLTLMVNNNNSNISSSETISAACSHSRSIISVPITSPTNSSSTTTTTNVATPSNPAVSELNMQYPELSPTAADVVGMEDSPPSYTIHTYDDDELNFMQSFFGNKKSYELTAVNDWKMTCPLAAGTKQSFENNNSKEDQDYYYSTASGFINPLEFINYSGIDDQLVVVCGAVDHLGGSSSTTPNPNPCKSNFQKNNEEEEDMGSNRKTHMCSDLYLSYLLDGGSHLQFTSDSSSKVNMDFLMD